MKQLKIYEQSDVDEAVLKWVMMVQENHAGLEASDKKMAVKYAKILGNGIKDSHFWGKQKFVQS